MNDAELIAGFVCITVTSTVWAKVYVTLRMAQIRAGLAENAAQFVMMEKAAKPFKVKAHKTPAPIPYGL